MATKRLVALVGRPNVGKSTLFNRIVGRRMAVVSEVAGTTRDRLYAAAEWAGVSFNLVDTGGLEYVEGRSTKPLSEDSDRFLELIRQQAGVAIQDADVVVQVVDGDEGMTAADSEVADVLRRSRKPVLVAVNKLESSAKWDNKAEFYELALGEVFAVSALHGSGTGDLLDAITEALGPSEPVEEDESIKIALLGRPNVGKSTLLNKLLGEERAIVSPIAGTTRDATDTLLTWNDQEFTLIDTAGIRRRGKVEPGVEKYSVLRAIKALERANVALLLIDSTEPFTAQDVHIAGMLADEQTSIIVLLNKWDLVEKDQYTLNEYTDELRSKLNFMPYVPVIPISALSGNRVDKILPLALQVYESRFRRIPTSQLNRILRVAVSRHPHPHRSGHRVKFMYATQASVDPPTFIFFVNRPDDVHFSYQRYLENQIREELEFIGTPISLQFRARSEDRFASKD